MSPYSGGRMGGVAQRILLFQRQVHERWIVCYTDALKQY